MDKRPDFGKDLATLSENVTAEVGDVLLALRQKKTASRPAAINTGETMEQQPVTSNAQTEPDDTASANSPRRSRPANRSRLRPIIERDATALENVTTRLRRETNELLTESALRQRLKKEEPATRQDIVEAALSDWFRKHGYALGRDSGEAV